MKTSRSLILAALTVTIVLIACNSSTSDSTTAANDDTASTAGATAGNTNDESTQEEANKKLVLEFYQSLYGEKDSNAIDKYIADDIKQHNPLLKDGKQWLKDALRPFLENPNIEKTKIEIPLVAAEGDKVWLLAKDVAPNGKVFARVNIFRIENDKVVEAWKVSEPVPAKSENPNSMF
ncbi:MAG TPA: nuclear transport factor 2 family protein [Parafilimonas sp.]|nr:nuclear transport factor 2 family protein [Parafilimonas sp.]